MNLGAFSVSLAVKDINASKEFYEHLGFDAIGGDISQNWLIMRNNTHTIGLFQGMFDKNMLTFNPGWDKNGYPVDNYTDVRDLQRKLKSDGLEIINPADEQSQGPASFAVVDPDGNMVLIDQHV